MSDYWKDNNIKKPQQKIVCAACEYDGVIILGVRHWDKLMNRQYDMMRNSDKWKEYNSVPSGALFEQGFVDQFGAFLTRTEAMEVVKENGQPFDLERNGDEVELYSEGLY